MSKFTTAAILGALGGLGTFHVYRGYYKPTQDGFLQFVEEDITLLPVFMDWMSYYGRSYADKEEFDKRFENFKATVQAVDDYKVARDALRAINNDVPDHEVEVNQLADLSLEEYNSMLGFKPDVNKK